MRSSATATASARRKAGSIVMTVPPWRIRSAANAVSDAVGERDRRLAVGIARGAEGDVSEGEDDAAVRVALEVHHVRLEPEAHAAVATAQVEVMDAERGGPGILLDALPELGADLGVVRRAHRLPCYNLSP